MAVAHVPASLEAIYRRNFVFFLIDNILFNVAMGIMGITTVIPAFVRELTDVEILIGLSGNMFAIGYTLPQLFIARLLRRHARKKWWFAGPNIPVRLMMLLFAGLALTIGDQRDLLLLAFLVCYGIAALGDGLVGVPWADLVGTSLDPRWRARMLGLTVATSGTVLLTISPWIGSILGAAGPGFPTNYATLFGVAGTLLALSIIPCLFIRELPGARAHDELPPMRMFLPELAAMLREDPPFRGYVAIRALCSLSLMAAPFYIGYATTGLGLASDVAVPTLLAMQMIGSVAGALTYTWLGARDNIAFIRVALVCAALQPVCGLIAGLVGPWPLYLGFLVYGVAASNLLISLLNWLVNYAGAERRPVYVGLSNTIAALALLVAPIIGGTIVARLGYEVLFGTTLLVVASAMVLTWRVLRNTVRDRAA
jgi:MFS family permease